MRPIAPCLVLFLCTGGYALDVRKSSADYPAQGRGKDIEVGADYTVGTFLADGHSFSIDDYLLVEVGVFPTGESNVHLQRFTLRVNGNNLLTPQTPGMVAASVKYPDWTNKPNLQVQAGPVILGRTRPTGRFPGDRREEVPRRDPVAVESKTNPIDYTDVIGKAALPEGPTRRPVAGYIFFAYDGKLKSIRSVELLVDGVPLSLR
jgi:hypothetical protein